MSLAGEREKRRLIFLNILLEFCAVSQFSLPQVFDTVINEVDESRLSRDSRVKYKLIVYKLCLRRRLLRCLKSQILLKWFLYTSTRLLVGHFYLRKPVIKLLQCYTLWFYLHYTTFVASYQVGKFNF